MHNAWYRHSENAEEVLSRIGSTQDDCYTRPILRKEHGGLYQFEFGNRWVTRVGAYRSLNLNCLLVIRQIDNHSPGGVTGGKLVPSSHER